MVMESTKYCYKPITNNLLQFNIKYIINTVTNITHHCNCQAIATYVKLKHYCWGREYVL